MQAAYVAAYVDVTQERLPPMHYCLIDRDSVLCRVLNTSAQMDTPSKRQTDIDGQRVRQAGGQTWTERQTDTGGQRDRHRDTNSDEVSYVTQHVHTLVTIDTPPAR